MSLKRRNFIKSLGFAGVGAATFPLKEATAAERPQNWDKEVDVLIIGYGGAGASAAMRAHDERSQVLVIERRFRKHVLQRFQRGFYRRSEANVGLSKCW